MLYLSVSRVEGPGSMPGWEFVVHGEQSGFGKGFSPSSSFSHVSLYSIIASYSFSIVRGRTVDSLEATVHVGAVYRSRAVGSGLDCSGVSFKHGN